MYLQSETARVHNTHELPQSKDILQKRVSQHLAITSLGVTCSYCNFPSVGKSILQRSCSVYKTTVVEESLRITSSGEQKTYQCQEQNLLA